MNEENQTTTVKKGGKAKKIIIAIVAIIVVLAIVFGILIATGKFDLNLSKKSKMQAGIEQLGEAFTKPLDSLAEAAEKNGTAIKITENMNKDSAIEASAEVSAKIDSLDIDSLSSSEQKDIDSVVDVINSSKLGMDVRYDGNKSAYAKINADIDSAKISGEAFYDGTQAGIRSEELNTKWITMSKSYLEDQLVENGLDIDDIKKIISTATEQMDSVMNSVQIDEKTQKEIRKRYSEVLKDFIKEKSKDIKTESTKVEVDGKDKRCTKLTLKLDEDDVKDLAKEYLDTFAKDKQLKEIITTSANAYAKIMEEAGESSTANAITSMVDELYNNIDDVKDEIDDLDFESTVKLTVYATATKVYRTDIDADIDGSEISLETTFNKENSETVISADGTKVATLTITSKENEVNAKLEASQLIIGKETIELNYKVEDKKSEMKLAVNAGVNGSATIVATSEVTTNEDDEYAGTTTISLDIDIPNEITTKMTITVKSNIKIGSVSIPKVSSSDSVDIEDEEGLNEYANEASKNLEELGKKLYDIEALKPIFDEVLDSVDSTINSQINTLESDTSLDLDNARDALDNARDTLDSSVDSLDPTDLTF